MECSTDIRRHVQVWVGVSATPLLGVGLSLTQWATHPTLSGGTWTFTPDAEDLTKVMIPGSNYDADYLSFGYWVQSDGKI